MFPGKFYDVFVLDDDLINEQRYVWVLLSKNRRVLGIYSSDENTVEAVHANERNLKTAEERGLPKALADDMRIHCVVKVELSNEPYNVRPWNELPPEGLITLSE